MLYINDFDPNFKYKILSIEGGSTLCNCSGCGACVACCPIANFYPNYNPRCIIRLVVFGAYKYILSSSLIWLCTGCYSCREVCPQKVCFTDILVIIQNLAIKFGYLPLSIKGLIKQFINYGRLLEVDEFENRKRVIERLPPLSSPLNGYGGNIDIIFSVKELLNIERLNESYIIPRLYGSGEKFEL